MKRTTWKNDKDANNHGALLSTALGRDVTVKGSRAGKAKRNAVSGDPSGHELVRHVSSPFEITLIAGVRASQDVKPDKANMLMWNALEKYVDQWRSWLDKTDTDTEGTYWWKIRNIIHDFSVQMFASLDTMRCAEIANQKYMRTSCLDVYNEATLKDIDVMCNDESKVNVIRAENELLWSLIMSEFLDQKNIVAKHSKHAWHVDTTHHERWGMPEVVKDEVLKIASKYKDRCKPENLQSGKDTIVATLEMSVDLLHLLSKIDPPQNQGGGEGNGGGGITIDDGDTKAGAEENGEGHSTNQTHVDVQNAFDWTFDETVNAELDELFEDMYKKEKQEEGDYMGGAKDPHVREEYKVQVEDSDGETDLSLHECKVIRYPQEPVPLDGNTVNLLEDVERMGIAHRHRTGMPTPDIWQMKKLGNTKVFGKSAHKSGKLLVMVDCSGSMGHAYVKDSNGYLAFQASTALAEAFPQAEVYGFNSNNDQCFIYPIQQGYMLGVKAQENGFRLGGNTDCYALLFMEQMMKGEFADSMAVIISDGSPNSPSPLTNTHLHAHTKSVSHRLYDEGLRFISVLVGDYYDTTYYPSDVVVQLASTSDMHKVGEAIQRIGQTFN